MLFICSTDGGGSVCGIKRKGRRIPPNPKNVNVLPQFSERVWVGRGGCLVSNIRYKEIIYQIYAAKWDGMGRNGCLMLILLSSRLRLADIADDIRGISFNHPHLRTLWNCWQLHFAFVWFYIHRKYFKTVNIYTT